SRRFMRAAAPGSGAKRSTFEPPDEFREALELTFEEIARSVVLQLTLLIELRLRRADEDLRRVERVGAEKDEHRAQVILHARAAERPLRGRLDRDRLVPVRLGLEAPDPVPRRFLHAWGCVVV